jgi:hypothetical protein
LILAEVAVGREMLIEMGVKPTNETALCAVLRTWLRSINGRATSPNEERSLRDEAHRLVKHLSAFRKMLRKS